MGHDTYDTQELYYVNLYIIYYLIFSTYSKIARESNTNYNLLKLIKNLNLFLKSRNSLLNCNKVIFLIDVSLLTIFQIFDFLTCSPSSKWIPNKLLITCLIISHTLFEYVQLLQYILPKYTCTKVDNNYYILVPFNVSINFFNDEAIKDDHINWKTKKNSRGGTIDW
jgi:hypothetical protein